MDTFNPRRRRGRVFGLGAAIALVALLLPFTAAVVLGHTASSHCDQISNDYNLQAWAYTLSTPYTTGEKTAQPGAIALPAAVGSVHGTVTVAPGSYYVVWSDGFSQGVPTSESPYNQNSATSLVVGACPTTTFTQVLQSTANAGDTIGDTAHVAQVSGPGGSSSPTGTVTFTLYGPTSSAVCNGSDVVGHVDATLDTSGNATTASSGVTLPSTAGTYEWVANYKGDGNNNPSSSTCGAEPVTVNAPPTGSLQLAKTLTGGPGYTGPFTIHYACVSATSGDAVVSVGSPVTISGIPTGTSCAVTEPTFPSVAGYSFGTPTFTESSGTPNDGVVTIGNNTTVTVTTNNTLTRDLGNLVLAKSLTGGPNDYTGPFTINYDCGEGFTGTVSVSAGTSKTITGIPTGTSCTVSETPPTAPAGYTFGTPTFSPSATVQIPAGNGSSVTVTTNNTLTRDLGSLVLAKTLTGGPNDYTGPFTIGYNCGEALTGTVSVAAGSSATVSGIPTGTSCTISETPPTAPTGYSFGTPTFSPSATVQIPAGNGSSVTVTTNNTLTRDVSGLKLTKVLTGGPVGFNGPFTIHYDCNDGTAHDGSVSLTAGTSQTITGIPTGTSCTVSEPSLPSVPGYSFGTPTFSTSATVTIASTTTTVEVTTNNTLTANRGSLIVTKAVTGYTGFTGSFPISVSCTGEESPRTGTIVYPTPGSVTFTYIAAGSICTVTEGTRPAAPGGYTWGVVSYTGNPATIPPGGTATVGITNPLIPPAPVGSLQIIKNVTGTMDSFPGGTFNFTVTCGTSSQVVSITLAAGVLTGSVGIGSLTPGISCTVVENTPLPNAGTNASWGTPTYVPSNGTVVIVDAAVVTVTANNPRTVTLRTPTPTATPSPSPTGQVQEATGRPHVTPPPTTMGGMENTGNPGSSLALVLLALAFFALVLGVVTPKPARARRRNRRG